MTFVVLKARDCMVTKSYDVTGSRAGPTTAFGRVVGRQAYTKIYVIYAVNIIIL